ncbi:MAG TPA: MFS transporter [Gaiella sp.]
MSALGAAATYLRGLRPGLPRDVYVLQAGLVVNAFGNGAANPFAVLYLHDVRGIPLAVAGLAGSASAACSLLAAGVAGSLADRRGARGVMVGGLVVSAAGWSLYPLVREPWHALALAVLTGTGIGAWLTMQSTMLALIVPAHLRHVAFAQQRVAANLGLGLGGFAGGLLITTAEPATFTALFLLNAVTFLAYAVVLARLRPPARPVAGRERGYREVFRDRVFLRVIALNLVLVASVVALLNSMFPVFAKDEAGVSEDVVGLFFLVNSLVIVGAQLPVARAIEGRRRAHGLALMCLLFACTWALVEVAGLVPAAAAALLLLGVTLLSFGECLYDSIYGPLVADLAPEGRTGRYMAASGLSWQLGFITAPAVGGAILGAEPFALWPLAAGLALAAGAYAFRLERALPAELRRTPRRTASG